MTFERAFQELILREGGWYVNDPADSGSATKYGITEAVARRHGYAGTMRELPLETAHAIYKAQYWDLLFLDQVPAVTPSVAEHLFDLAVHCGAGMAGRSLQRLLNALNRGGSDYPDLVVDGLLGPATRVALQTFLARRGMAGAAVLVQGLQGLQAAHYIALAEQREKDERFVYGWLRRVGAVQGGQA